MALWQFWTLIGVLVAILFAIIKVFDAISVNGLRLNSNHDAIKGVHNMLDEISGKISKLR